MGPKGASPPGFPNAGWRVTLGWGKEEGVHPRERGGGRRQSPSQTDADPDTAAAFTSPASSCGSRPLLLQDGFLGPPRPPGAAGRRPGAARPAGGRAGAGRRRGSCRGPARPRVTLTAGGKLAKQEVREGAGRGAGRGAGTPRGANGAGGKPGEEGAETGGAGSGSGVHSCWAQARVPAPLCCKGCVLARAAFCTRLHCPAATSGEERCAQEEAERASASAAW